MKITSFLLFLIFLIALTNSKKLSIIEDKIELQKSGQTNYEIAFPNISEYSTYYISIESKHKLKNHHKEDIKLYLSGNCFYNCSNNTTKPDEKENCEEIKEFIYQDYYLLKLVPNQECDLYFTIELQKHMDINILLHYQPVIKATLTETIPIMFPIPLAPIFIEYTPKFPDNFISQAKIFVKEIQNNLQEVYFGKLSNYENCNTHFPNKEEHCFAFQQPKEYFIAFDYTHVVSSNLYIAIYPKENVNMSIITIGFALPFLPEHAECPPHSYLIKENTDTFCKYCIDHCDKCQGVFCDQCENNYKLFNNSSCEKSECDGFDKYKNDKGICVDCKEQCKYCSSEKKCLECWDNYTLFQGKCLNKSECIVMINDSCVPDCGYKKYYNFTHQKCKDCIDHCKYCSNGETCEECKGGYYKNENGECKESPLCKPNGYLAKPGNYCLSCPLYCESCRNETYCLTCIKGFSLVGHQQCAPSCAKYQYYNLNNSQCEKCIDNCQECRDNTTCEICIKGKKYGILQGVEGCIVEDIYGSRLDNIRNLLLVIIISILVNWI